MRIPKADLHIHLTGAYPLSYLRQISSKENLRELKRSLKAIRKRQIDYSSVFQVFGQVERIVDDEEKVFFGVCSLLEGLSRQNVAYAEIRTSLRDLGNGKRAYLEAVLSGLEVARKISRTETNLILSIKRDWSDKRIKETLRIAEEYQQKGVVGLDICGKEEKGDLRRIAELINQTDRTLQITAHIGELEDGTSLEDLTALAPARVSHAVLISPSVQEYLKQTKIPIEVCITSNICTGLVRKLGYHPFDIFYLVYKSPVCICSDDPLIFSTSTSKEYRRFRNFSDRQKLELYENAIKYSFASEDTKNKLLGRVKNGE